MEPVDDDDDDDDDGIGEGEYIYNSEYTIPAALSPVVKICKLG